MNNVIELTFCEGGNRANKHGVCSEQKCQSCCPHDDRDHFICLECGHEQDPGELIDAVMDRMEDR